METYSKNIADYIAILKRRKYHILIPWLLLSLVAVGVALSLPKTYKSTVTMVMQTPMPTELTDTPVHFLADEQIQTIYQRVLTTENVLSIIDAKELYGNKKDNSTKYDLVEAFKDSTEVKLATSSLSDGSSKIADVVFDLSFNYDEPKKAQEVVTELSHFLIEQNDKARTQRAAKVTDFLSEELDKLSLKSQEIDRKIAKYKEQNIFSLPEQAQGNLAAIERMESELRDTDNLIRTTKDKITYLGLELARVQTEIPGTLDDKTPKSKDEVLRILQAKYSQLSGIYSPSHPDVVRVRRELQALGSMAELSPLKGDIIKRLAESERELNLLEQTYTGNHPELVNRKKQIDDLKQQLKNSSSSSSSDGDLRSHSSNPAYVGLQVQYKDGQSELKSLLQKQEYLKTKLEKTQTNLSVSPQVEMEYAELIRQRDSATKKYNQIKEKWLDAKLVQTMEEQQQGHTLTVIEPPFVPPHPEKAIRRKVAIGGFFAGLIAGIGLAFLAEFLDPGIRGYRSLIATTGFTPLVVIPYIETSFEVQNKLKVQHKEKKMLAWTFLLGLILAAATLFYFFPLLFESKTN